jgi:pentatricopeptide repeat protein
MFKNILVEAAGRLMFYGISIIDTYAKSKMIIDDVCRVFDRMHAHIM